MFLISLFLYWMNHIFYLLKICFSFCFCCCYCSPSLPLSCFYWFHFLSPNWSSESESEHQVRSNTFKFVFCCYLEQNKCQTEKSLLIVIVINIKLGWTIQRSMWHKNSNCHFILNMCVVCTVHRCQLQWKTQKNNNRSNSLLSVY